MYICRNIKWNIILRLAWLNLIVFLLWSAFVTCAFHFFEYQNFIISIPFLTLNLIGTILFSILIAWMFFTSETAGDNNENSFENFVNDVPTTALCKAIKIILTLEKYLAKLISSGRSSQ